MKQFCILYCPTLPAHSLTFIVKTSHQKNESDVLLDHFPSGNNNTWFPLNTLEKLLGEIIDSPHSAQNHTSAAGSGVVKAAAELAKALKIARTSPNASAHTVDYNIDYMHRENLHDASDILEGESGLPVLPLILDEGLQKAVFTHPGLNNNNKTTYDRLEILGDAYIELIATKLVWDKFQDIPSGRISQIRELLVKNETLSEYATRYGFDRRASVPQGYLDQPKRWTKTKGDIFEAYVAAVILSNRDGGFKLVESWLTQLWLPKLTELGIQKSILQAKEALSKKVMAKGVKLDYVDELPPVASKGGMQTFFLGVYFTGWGWDRKHLGSGQGRNKAIAGDEAAKQALRNNPLIDEIAEKKRLIGTETKTKSRVD